MVSVEKRVEQPPERWEIVKKTDSYKCDNKHNKWELIKRERHNSNWWINTRRQLKDYCEKTNKPCNYFSCPYKTQ